MSAHGHDIQKEVRGYIIVFVALAALTIITVAVKSLHLEIHEAVIVALVIATFKGSLVVCYFMHLISEKRLIYIILIFTVFFFLALIILLLSGYHGAQTGVKFVS